MTGRAQDGGRRRFRLPGGLKSFSWYSVFAVVNFCINVFGTALLHEGFGLAASLAFAVTLSLAFLVSFLSFRYVVLEGAKEAPLHRQLAAFLISSLCFRGAEYLAFILLHSVFGLYYLLSVLTVLTVSFFAKFLFYSRHVFGARSKRVAMAEKLLS